MINKVTLTITRDSRSFEEIFMTTYTGAGFMFFNTKNFSNWDNNTMRIELPVALNLIIKVRMINDGSNYSINVRQEYSKSIFFWIFIAVCFTVSVLLTIAIALIIIVCFKTKRQQIIYLSPDTQEDVDYRKEYIHKCLDNMKRDEYRSIRVKFDQNNCIICLEDFEPQSEVYITNEWNHVFHHACLKSWFENVQIRRDLTCPHWNTTITDTSETPSNGSVHEYDEVSASIEFNSPAQMLHQNVLKNYVALISRIENDRLRDTARVDSEECFAANLYEDMDLNMIHSEEAKLSSQHNESNQKKIEEGHFLV